MATIHANTQLKTGDTVNGLSGLKDCESGRCLNLRLDGKAVAPQGWESVCKPPESDYYFTLEGSLGKYWPSAGHRRMLPKTSFRTRQEMIAAAETFYGKYFTKNRTSQPHNGEAEDPGSSIAEQMRIHESGAITNNTFREPPKDPGFKYSIVSAVCWFGKISCSASYADKEICRKPALETWPKETCSELIYDAASGRFKPACAQHDPHLPESLKNERRCLSLCDAEGNCVIIRRTERGIELWQEKYKQRALIDPATGKVQAVVGEEKGAVKLKLTSLTTATLPANRERTTIGVGEGVTVSANQPVEWSIKGSLLEKEEKTATELGFIASDQAGIIRVTARTECEEQSVEFSVIRPTDVKFVKEKGIHAFQILNAGFVARLYLQPIHVNFYNVAIHEMDSKSYGGTGLLSEYNGRNHGIDYFGGHSDDMEAISYDPAHGTLMNGKDRPHVSHSVYCPHNIPHSEIHLSIPYEWYVRGIGSEHLLVMVHQSAVIDEKGYITTRKANESVTFHYSDPTVNMEEMENLGVRPSPYTEDC
jgi:hypothetical protein